MIFENAVDPQITQIDADLSNLRNLRKSADEPRFPG